MPKTKAPKKESSSDSDSGPDDVTPMKKSKPAEQPASKGKGGGDDADKLSWDLGKNRKIELTEFKGKWYVSVREYYMADAGMRPGKKGIMLTLEQWRTISDAVPDIDAAIKRHV